ncbi:hypothetical protein ACIRQP_21085 [Streptomyces sp. NPDC102274]|uniref:hypothetical protein n=1 Tax=Streptomyces sp. NPDC102274 TaxID=3366151 RepID=UPI0037F1547D
MIDTAADNRSVESVASGVPSSSANVTVLLRVACTYLGEKLDETARNASKASHGLFREQKLKKGTGQCV